VWKVIEGIPFFHRYCHDVTLRQALNDSVCDISLNILVTEPYGIELGELRRIYGRGLPFATFVDLAKQIFAVMNFLHNVSSFFCPNYDSTIKKNLIHRDITPSKFTIVRSDETGDRKMGHILLKDFGLAKITKQRDNDGDVVDIQRQLNRSRIIGTTRFISEHVMGRDTPSYRDDLISCCYVLREMTDEGLPWSNNDRYVADDNMLAMKRDTDGTSLFGDSSIWRSAAYSYQSPDCSSLVQLFDLFKNLDWMDQPDFKLKVSKGILPLFNY